MANPHDQRSEPLRILSWNTRSFHQNWPALEQSLQELQTDIALLQETRLMSPRTSYGEYWNVEGNFPDRGRGTNIFVHKSLKFSRVPIALPVEGGLEVAVICLHLASGPLYVASIYAVQPITATPETWTRL